MKQTWIKVRRGILDPKHRIKLGAAWQMYLYMLFKANWEDGAIMEWRDADVAEELEMPLPTVRDQRRKLENELYITSSQKHHRLEIYIKKWIDPRNPSHGDTNGDENLSPLEIHGDNDGYIHGDTNGDTHGDESLTPLHLINISHNHISDNQIKLTPHQIFIKEFLKIIPHDFKNNDQPDLLKDMVEDYGMERVLSVAGWCATKRPKSMGHAISMMKTALKSWKDKPEKPQSAREWLEAEIAKDEQMEATNG